MFYLLGASVKYPSVVIRYLYHNIVVIDFSTYLTFFADNLVNNMELEVIDFVLKIWYFTGLYFWSAIVSSNTGALFFKFCTHTYTHTHTHTQTHTHTHTHTYIYLYLYIYIYIHTLCVCVCVCVCSFKGPWHIPWLQNSVFDIYEVHTISFQTFFVWALLLIVHTWNSSPLRSNLLRLQCTCSTVPTNSSRTQTLRINKSHREQGLDYRVG